MTAIGMHQCRAAARGMHGCLCICACAQNNRKPTDRRHNAHNIYVYCKESVSTRNHHARRKHGNNTHAGANQERPSHMHGPKPNPYRAPYPYRVYMESRAHRAPTHHRITSHDRCVFFIAQCSRISVRMSARGAFVGCAARVFYVELCDCGVMRS